MTSSSEVHDIPLRFFEPILAVCVWFLVFMLVIGPALGTVHPWFQEPVFTEEEVADRDYRGDFGEIINSPRGVVMFVLAIPIFVGYFFVRPQLVGADPGEFWNPSGEDQE